MIPKSVPSNSIPREDSGWWEYSGTCATWRIRRGAPSCRIVVLGDAGGDGRRTGHGVSGQTVLPARWRSFGGVLIHEPPHVWFCGDTDDDLPVRRKREVGTLGLAGDPRTPNGLRPGIDNWLHNADREPPAQWRNGEWIGMDTLPRGQFGVDFDETGRFLTCWRPTLCGT